MHHHTELSFVDEFQWVSPLHYLKKGMTKRSSFWCMLEAGPRFLHYYFAVVLHSCITLPPVAHSSYHEYHYCQLTRQTSCVLNFYCTFKIFNLNLPRIKYMNSVRHNYKQRYGLQLHVSTYKVIIRLSEEPWNFTEWLRAFWIPDGLQCCLKLSTCNLD
jgi:hypothetical protein